MDTINALTMGAVWLCLLPGPDIYLPLSMLICLLGRVASDLPIDDVLKKKPRHLYSVNVDVLQTVHHLHGAMASCLEAIALSHIVRFASVSQELHFHICVVSSSTPLTWSWELGSDNHHLGSAMRAWYAAVFTDLITNYHLAKSLICKSLVNDLQVQVKFWAIAVNSVVRPQKLANHNKYSLSQISSDLS